MLRSISQQNHFNETRNYELWNRVSVSQSLSMSVLQFFCVGLTKSAFLMVAQFFIWVTWDSLGPCLLDLSSGLMYWLYFWWFVESELRITDVYWEYSNFPFINSQQTLLTDCLELENACLRQLCVVLITYFFRKNNLFSSWFVFGLFLGHVIIRLSSVSHFLPRDAYGYM